MNDTKVHASADTRFFDLRESFRLRSGESLDGVRVAYRTWGEPKDSAILVCHALTGSADADVWWAGMFGTGRAFDPARDFIVAANVLGSCYGTTGPTTAPPDGDRYGPRFPAVSIVDMVRLQKLLLDHLGVERLELVIGGSMGGMQVLAWAEQYPAFIDQIVSIGVGPAQSAWAIALSEPQRAAIVNDPKFLAGSYDPADPPAVGLGIARMIAMCAYRSPESFATRFGREVDGHTYQAQSYLQHQATKLAQRFDANSYLRLIDAMDNHDSDPARITARALVVGISSDVLYPADEARALAGSLPNGEYCTLVAPHGHDSFLIETQQLSRIVTRFRKGRLCDSIGRAAATGSG